MGWASFDKLLPKIGKKPLLAEVSVALALESGTNYLATRAPLLKTRVRLVSLRQGVLHALVTSGPAAAELRSLKEGLFKVMREQPGSIVTELRITIKSVLAEGSES